MDADERRKERKEERGKNPVTLMVPKYVRLDAKKWLETIRISVGTI